MINQKFDKIISDANSEHNKHTMIVDNNLLALVNFIS